MICCNMPGNVFPVVKNIAVFRTHPLPSVELELMVEPLVTASKKPVRRITFLESAEIWLKVLTHMFSLGNLVPCKPQCPGRLVEGLPPSMGILRRDY